MASSIQSQLSSVFSGETVVKDGSSFAVKESNQRIFVKIGQGGDDTVDKDMLKYEYEGLSHLRASANGSELYIPKPILYGTDERGKGFICVEHLELSSSNASDAARLGRGLAKMHKNQSNRLYNTFGFPIDGCCGAGRQLNDVNQTCQNWVDFWNTYRLGDQLAVIKSKFPTDVKLQELGAQLQKRLPELFSGLIVEDIVPSVLHGDLWSGNWGMHGGIPTMFDPAVYYGHHEADLGIARMFGGFGKSFFEAYHSVLPKKEGYERRALLYELHHHLNHYQIFGRGYRGGAVDLMTRILKFGN